MPRMGSPTASHTEKYTRTLFLSVTRVTSLDRDGVCARIIGISTFDAYA